MENRSFGRRLALIAATLLVTALVSLPDLAVAQGNGNRPGRERRRDRDAGENNRAADARPVSPAQAAASSTSFGTVSDAERISKQASDLIQKHDKSGNAILEGDELSELGMSRGADQDGDQKITKNELVAFYSPKSSSSTSASSTKASDSASDGRKSSADKSGDPSKSGDERKLVNDKRKSYRFKTAKERLSSWRFASKDANGDGQVAMSEYSRSWTDRTAAEFQRYDRNNDGMITSEESR